MTAAIAGIDAFPVVVETVLSKGAGFSIVGLPDAAVKESYQRITAAFAECGLRFPHFKTLVNLAPADVKKEGASFDLPTALGILLAGNEEWSRTETASVMVTGELSLSGDVLPVKGALPMAILARKMGLRKLIVPEANVTEAAVVNNLDVYGVSTLTEALEIILGTSTINPV